MKTPNFDEAIKEYFSNLELDENGGQWRVCRFSGNKFYVRPDDIAFYKAHQVPLPTLSPNERIRRKLAFQNSYNLFKIKSAYSGDSIISQYPSNTPFKVFGKTEYYGDKWNPEDYARNYDRNEKFFPQLQKLMLNVPKCNLNNNPNNIDSDYCNNSSSLKNCYLVFDAHSSEDSAYSISPFGSRNCFDCFDPFNCDTCYNCFESENLFHCYFVEYSKDCLYSYFLYDCRDCDHCFGSVNLRHKKYHFFNQPLTKEEYEAKMKEINLGDRNVLQEYITKFEEIKKKAFNKQDHNEKSINCSGEYLNNSKNCFSCYYEIGGENLAYCIGGMAIRDSYDIVGGIEVESCYECWGRSDNYGNKFCDIASSQNMEYSVFCRNCHDCFGCDGLSNKSFCVFNKQYTEEDYNKLVDAIKTKMLADGEYGEFMPPELAYFPYNISIATSYLGYDNLEIAKKYGYKIEEVPENLYDIKEGVIDSQDVPADIKDVGDDILSKVIFDRKNNKKFRYTKMELDFYRRNNLPLPLEHYSVRLANLRKKFGSIVLNFYERNCDKCKKAIESTYTPEDERIVYCEECYKQEIV